MVARVPIPAGMDDSFAFGKPSRKRSLPAAPRPKGQRADTGSGRGRIVAVVAAGVVIVLLVVGFMTFVKGSGEQIASDQQTVISQIGAAKDVEAQTTEQQAITAVQELYAEQGSFDRVTVAALKHFEPAFSYTDNASSGPKVIAVGASSSGIGLAVLSQSGTCFYLHIAASSVRYGTGTTCTGTAALSAAATSWPP
jgi:hypothetical protein